MTKSTAIQVKCDPSDQLAGVASGNPLNLPASAFREGLDRRTQNRTALLAWVRDALVEGSDFGKLHVLGKNRCQAGPACQNPSHFSKPSLFKPGAEKICGLLGVTVRYPSLPDYEQAALAGKSLSVIILRCELLDSGSQVIADGIGARTLAQDNGDLNKALKMAEKSAHIDATLRMAGLSEVFTQDIEDLLQRREAESLQQAERELTPAFEGITQAQYQQLEARIQELHLDRERVKAWMTKASQARFTNFLELSQTFYHTLYHKLEDFAKSSALTPHKPS